MKKLNLALAMAGGLVWSSCYLLTDFDNLDSEAGTPAGVGGTSGSGGTQSSGGSGGVGATGAGGAGGTGGSGGTTGSGGAAPCPPPGVNYGSLVINEVAPSGVPEDWIEIHNTGTESVPLCAVFVTQDYSPPSIPNGDDRFTFGEVSVGPGAYLVITRDVDFPFGLSKSDAERITLFAPDGTVLDDTTYDVPGPPSNEYTASLTWGRFPDGNGDFKILVVPTKGDSNQDPGGTGGGGSGTGGGGGGGGS